MAFLWFFVIIQFSSPVFSGLSNPPDTNEMTELKTDDRPAKEIAEFVINDYHRTHPKHTDQGFLLRNVSKFWERRTAGKLDYWFVKFYMTKKNAFKVDQTRVCEAVVDKWANARTSCEEVDSCFLKENGFRSEVYEVVGAILKTGAVQDGTFNLAEIYRFAVTADAKDSNTLYYVVSLILYKNPRKYSLSQKICNATVQKIGKSPNSRYYYKSIECANYTERLEMPCLKNPERCSMKDHIFLSEYLEMACSGIENANNNMPRFIKKVNSVVENVTDDLQKVIHSALKIFSPSNFLNWKHLEMEKISNFRIFRRVTSNGTRVKVPRVGAKMIATTNNSDTQLAFCVVFCDYDFKTSKMTSNELTALCVPMMLKSALLAIAFDK